VYRRYVKMYSERKEEEGWLKIKIYIKISENAI
jgi:hypothetical protein